MYTHTAYATTTKTPYALGWFIHWCYWRLFSWVYYVNFDGNWVYIELRYTGNLLHLYRGVRPWVWISRGLTTISSGSQKLVLLRSVYISDGIMHHSTFSHVSSQYNVALPFIPSMWMWCGIWWHMTVPEFNSVELSRSALQRIMLS